MDFDGEESGFCSGLPHALVYLTPFPRSVSPSPRRLSSCFMQPAEPVKPIRSQLAWVSLQGRLVGAEEACSARTVDKYGALSAEEAAAWEVFTPIQRVLIVAVAAAASANSNKNKQISRLLNSVQLRDQVLLSMQQKLDNLCEQVNYSNQPEVVSSQRECDCKPCQHLNLPANGSSFNTSSKGLHEGEVFRCSIPLSNEAEPDERRMSGLSDWAPSVASSLDIQLENLAIEYDINSLRRECEEKDNTINELSTFLQSSEVLSSKRIAELEDIIRRKNTIINKLRKDVIILEQKVVNLTRLRRSSFSTTSANLQHPPVMADNVLYDMDPSSSDSDTSPRNHKQDMGWKTQEISVHTSERSSMQDVKCGRNMTSSNNSHNSVTSLKPKNEIIYASGENSGTRRTHVKSKEVAEHKRWA
ncbi:hypothetical protein ABFS83_04G055400 [Erythranthe nasuta]